jgi:hypothetical protein
MNLEELKTEARKLGYRLIPLDWKRKELKGLKPNGETKVEPPPPSQPPRREDPREPILEQLRVARVRKNWKLCIELEKQLAEMH